MQTDEFLYRLPSRVGGQRSGAHPGLGQGSGGEFIAHTSLFRRPDPRRLDLRASLRRVAALDDDWLVRVHRQRASVPVHLVVDVSASMQFGTTSTARAGRKKRSVSWRSHCDTVVTASLRSIP